MGEEDKSMSLNGHETATRLPKNTRYTLARSASDVPVSDQSNGSRFDSNEAFKRITKLIKRGVLSPSRFALERWVAKEYGIRVQRRDVEAWQGQLITKGLIEPYTTANGKMSHKLKVDRRGSV